MVYVSRYPAAHGPFLYVLWRDLTSSCRWVHEGPFALEQLNDRLILPRSGVSLFSFFLMCSHRDPNLLVCVLCLFLSHSLMHRIELWCDGLQKSIYGRD